MKKLFLNRGTRAAKLSLLLFLGVLASTQLTGCFTVGQEFSGSRVPEIKIGQSTKQDITEIFGRPWRTGMEDGKTTWTYGIYKYSLFGADDTQDLLVRFDNQGIVRSYTFSSTRK
ncbi:outer membrane protein assembly factor BamE domain-containing protein [Methylomonas rapida]|uniref:Outer membrane protein assembly factor BamE n=1 Tax=Methylomonas rapida TaxID=2963939 RepID=A0ABY7GI13_9GAMM|nr:outer membrane protein assembly factor BamE [Methylomonas rapida]WAR44874.1 outer membrane protein assembly factor BamE [Methylomonas rapida]